MEVSLILIKIVASICFYEILNREETNGQWILEHTLTGHNEWVRDVAWSPNIMNSKTSIASCSQVLN